MWCFRPSVPPPMPEGFPDEWSAAQVQQYLQHHNIKIKGGAFKGIDGKTLLSMDESAWSTLGNKAVTIRSQLKSLRKPVQQASRTATAKTTAPAASSGRAAMEQPSGRLTADNLMGMAGFEIPEEDEQALMAEAAAAEAAAAEAEAVAAAEAKAAADAAAAALAAAAEAEAAAAEAERQAKKAEMHKVFMAYTSLGVRDDGIVEMDSSKFMKLAKDCGLVDAKLKDTDVDIIFFKSKEKEKRRITFDQFLSALDLLAEKRGMTSADLHDAIITQGGPRLTGVTTAQSVRLHDDKSTYTGVYAKGGPTNVDEAQDLAKMLDRTPVGSSRKNSKLPPTVGSFNRTPPSDNWSKSCVLSMRRSTMSSAGGAPPDLKEVFTAFATFGMGARANKEGQVEMTNAKFVKLCKECGILDDKFNTIAADILFSQMKAKGANHIGFEAFQACLQEIAKIKSLQVEDVRSSIITSGGPMINTACVV